MTETELLARVEALETRLTHQDAALDELTRTSIDQARRLREQAEHLRRLEKQLRAAAPSPVAGPDEETPPPHY